MKNLDQLFNNTPLQIKCHLLAVEEVHLQAMLQDIAEAYDRELKKHRQRLRDRTRLRRRLAEYIDRMDFQSAEEREGDEIIQQLHGAIAAIDPTEPDALKNYLLKKQALTEQLRANEHQIRQFLLRYAQEHQN